jgi:adenylate cyclase
VIGDPVNVAARFEEETKARGAAIIVGESTVARASGFAFSELGTVMLRGKDRPERIFALQPETEP